MRRILSLLCALLLAVPLFSQNTLTVHQKDGQKFSFGFEEKPLVTFTETELVVKTSKIELRYALSRFSKFTFDDIPSSVGKVAVDVADKASITLDEYIVSISGAKADIEVRLIASDGKTLQIHKTDPDGSVSFSIYDLPDGTYIIASESLTCKIIKK